MGTQRLLLLASLLSGFVLTGCAQESFPEEDNSSNSSDGTSGYYLPPSTSTTSSSGTSSGGTTSGGTTYYPTTPTSTGGSWSSSPSLVTCPSDMTAIPQTDEQRSFCIDKQVSGSMGNMPANYYWSDRICQGTDANTTQNAGKHLCYMSEAKSAATQTNSATGSTYIARVGIWVKWVPAAVAWDAKDGYILDGTTTVPASQLRAFYCCK